LLNAAGLSAESRLFVAHRVREIPGNSDPKTQVKSESGAPNTFLAVYTGHPFVAHRVREMPGNSDPKTQVRTEPGAPNTFLAVCPAHHHPTSSWRFTWARRPQGRSELKSIKRNWRQVSFAESRFRDAYGKVLKRNLEERLQDFRLASAGAGQSGFAGVEVIVRGVS